MTPAHAVSAWPKRPILLRNSGREGATNTRPALNIQPVVEAAMSDRPDTGNPPAIQEIISRAEAKARGLTRYFTGEPCSRGHVAERMASNRRCCVCLKASKLAWEAGNPEIVKAQQARVTKKRAPAKAAYDAAYRAAKADKIQAYRVQYYRENKDAVKAKDAERRARDPEAHRARARAFYAANTEKCKASRDQWKRENRARVYAQNAARRARKKGAEGFYTAEQLDALMQRQLCKCANCGTSLKAGHHVDHIVPLIRGGSNWITNIQLLCPPCNLRKQAKDPIAFAQENGRLL